MDSIKFINCNEKNIDDIRHLHVRNDQLHYVESCEDSIKEATIHPYWNASGIYLNNDLIGFAMYGLYEDEYVKELWLDRFLIDKKYQGHGYGKASLLALFDLLKEKYDEDTLYLSVYDDNKDAISLYKSLGFDFDGKFDINGELVMEKRIR